jgi:hypothetical protein
VQCWERELRLPVRRIAKGPRSPVFAFKSERDRWLRSSTGVRACAARESSHDTRRNDERNVKPNAELLHALANLVCGEFFNAYERKMLRL